MKEIGTRRGVPWFRGAAADQVIEQIGVIDMVTKLVWMIAAIPIAGVGMRFTFC